MRLEKHLIAFGEFVMLGGVLLLSGEALAFGQQWRPAQGFAPATVRPYQRVANMPSFRPHGAARPMIQRSGQSYPQRSQVQSAYRQYQVRQLPYGQPHAAWQGYPQPRQPESLGHGFYRPPMPATAGYPDSGWPAPFVAAMQPWGHPMPMFTRQFGWRPASQPWVAHAPMWARPQYPQPQYRLPMAPQMTGFRPTVPGYQAPVVGSWRPTMHPARNLQPQYGYQRFAARPPVFPVSRQPMFRSAPGPGVQAPRTAAAFQHRNPVVAGQAYWRPGGTVAQARQYPGQSFRPRAYGRTPAPNKELASRDRPGLEITRNNLPGWVTTYQDVGYAGSCAWCGGS